jgi:hypothetical protein
MTTQKIYKKEFKGNIGSYRDYGDQEGLQAHKNTVTIKKSD